MVKLWLPCALLVWLPSIASAQTAVLFPVGGDPALSSAHEAELLGQVQRDLEESPFTVLAGAELESALTAAGAEPCASPSCAGPMLSALHADIGVAIALWPRHGVVQVSVVLVDPDGVQVSADADGAEAVVGQATESALAQARARWATRGGSPIRIEGSPAGAAISVDGAPWGTLPHDGLLSPGTHHFVVSADGHTTERRDVEIAAGTEPVTLTFALASEASATSAEAPGPDIGMMAGGGAALGLGAAVLALGIANAVDTEHCVSGCGAADPMRSVYVPATDVGIGLAVAGGVVMAAGAVLVIVGALSRGTHAPIATNVDGISIRF